MQQERRQPGPGQPGPGTGRAALAAAAALTLGASAAELVPVGEAVGIEVTDAYYKLGSDRVRFALEAQPETAE